MKKTICIILILILTLGLCSCGRSATYGVSEIVKLVEQDYSIAFRNNDDLYYYVTAAIEELNAAGTVSELSRKWFGDNLVSFPKKERALEQYGMPASRTFTIGVDTNSFPLAYLSNGVCWGYDVELAMAVCDRLGWTLNVHSIEKEDVYVELMSGNIDCAWGGLALDPKEVESGKYKVYGPYIHNDIVIASRDTSNIWNTLKLSGRTLAMCSTQEALNALATDPKLMNRLGQITRLAGGTTECFTYLYSGKCDIVLTDSTALYYYNSH